MKISKIFNLNKTQYELDFFDIQIFDQNYKLIKNHIHTEQKKNKSHK